jgi:hypothetical protein
MLLNKKLYRYRLKDERWSSLSECLKEVEEFICANCGNLFPYGKYLTVHHKYYIEDMEPWNYPFDAYQVLCLRCHDEIDHSKIHSIPNEHKQEMSEKKFIVTNQWGNPFYYKSYLPYNKYFNIALYGEIIDCGYITHFDDGTGRFDFELINRELNNNDSSYSRFRLNISYDENIYNGCLKIEDYIS